MPLPPLPFSGRTFGRASGLYAWTLFAAQALAWAILLLSGSATVTWAGPLLLAPVVGDVGRSLVPRRMVDDAPDDRPSDPDPACGNAGTGRALGRH